MLAGPVMVDAALIGASQLPSNRAQCSSCAKARSRSIGAG
jgi:hypothetical protein